MHTVYVCFWWLYIHVDMCVGVCNIEKHVINQKYDRNKVGSTIRVQTYSLKKL